MKRRKGITRKYTVYWTKNAVPEEWPKMNVFHFPFAEHLMHYRFGVSIIKKYLSFRLWLRRGSVED